MEAVAAADAGHGGRQRACNAEGATTGLVGEFGEAFAEGAGVGGFGAVDADEGEGAGGRVADAVAPAELAFGEGGVVVAADGLDDEVVWLVGLDEDGARFFCAAGASGDLGEELEGPFAAAEVGHAECAVGVEDSDQRDVGEVVALGEHLGADEDVEFACAEGVEDLPELFSTRAVAVEAADAEAGEGLGKGIFGPLGAGAAPFEPLGAAGGALGGDAGAGVAVVAAEEALLAVEGHGDIAVGAGDRLAAGLAEERGSVAPPVEEEDDLLAGGDGAVDGLVEPGAEDEAGGVLGLDEVAAHVDGVDGGQRAPCDPFGQCEVVELAAAGEGEGLEGGRCRAEHDGDAELGAEDESEVAGVVADAVFLLEAAVVLFVDDEQSEVLEGGEEGAAGAYDDPCLSASDAAPLVEALAGCEAGMEDRDGGGERGREGGDELGGEADFGEQDEGCATACEDLAGGPHVDLGFAAAGDAVEEDAARCGVVERGDDAGDRGRLVGGERGVGASSRRGSVGEGVAVDFAAGPADDAGLLEACERSGGDACDLREFRLREWSFGEGVERREL